MNSFSHLPDRVNHWFNDQIVDKLMRKDDIVLKAVGITSGVTISLYFYHLYRKSCNEKKELSRKIALVS
jgi:hypothetical protein